MKLNECKVQGDGVWVPKKAFAKFLSGFEEYTDIVQKKEKKPEISVTVKDGMLIFHNNEEDKDIEIGTSMLIDHYDYSDKWYTGDEKYVFRGWKA